MAIPESPATHRALLLTSNGHHGAILALRFGGACRSSASQAFYAPRFVVREVVPAWRNRQTRRLGRSLSESSCGFDSHRRHPPHYNDVAVIQRRCILSTLAEPQQRFRCATGAGRHMPTGSDFNIQCPFPQMSNARGSLGPAPWHFLGHRALAGLDIGHSLISRHSPPATAHVERTPRRYPRAEVRRPSSGAGVATSANADGGVVYRPTGLPTYRPAPDRAARSRRDW